mgnify:CR=1 FL=1
MMCVCFFFFFQAEDGIRDLVRSRGLGDVYKRQVVMLDVLDCGDPNRVARWRALYESYGFQSLASNPLRMFMPVSTVRKLIAEEDDVLTKEAALTELARLGQESDRG